MLITHLRCGFATNSSSVHSIILPSQPLKDYVFQPYQYGWEPFILASREEKERYIKATLVENIRSHGVPTAFLAYLGSDVPVDAYVDHNSLMKLPRNRFGEMDFAFFKEFSDWLLNTDVVILGGHDNDSEGLDWRPQGRYIEPELLSDWSKYEARKNGNYWILFRRIDGTKVRVRFHNDDLKPDWPELIDVNITDYCDFGCPFCYRDSTEKGEHANTAYIKRLFAALPYGTEIAIGGGDPMAHPDITEILFEGYDHGLVVNLTVRGTRWLADNARLRAVNQYVSGLGVSVNSARDAENSLSKILEKLDHQVHVVAHYIPSLGTEEDLTKLFEVLAQLRDRYHRVGGSLSLLLLGYKTTGRGANVQPKRIENLPRLIQKLASETYLFVGGDTALFHEYPSLHHSVGAWFKPDREGTFSMYVDAVQKIAYASSYQLDNGILLSLSDYRGAQIEIQRCFAYIRRHTMSI